MVFGFANPLLRKHRTLVLGLTIVACLVTAITISRALGGWSIVIAACLWAAALLGLAYVGHYLPWLHRYPLLTHALDYLVSQSLTGTVPSPASKPGKASSAGSTGPAAPDISEPKATEPDLSRLEGVASIKTQLDSLSRNTGLLRQARAPAVCVLLIGPHGVGKTTCARYLASRLAKTKTVQAPQVVVISEAEIPELVSEYGPSLEALTAVSERMRTALDGVLMLEDLDYLVNATGGGRAIEAIGMRLLKLAQDYPNRVLVIASVTNTALNNLDPNERWLGRLEVRPIHFEPLDPTNLETIAITQLRSAGITLDTDGLGELKSSLYDLSDGRSDFDNAHAVRRQVERIIQYVQADGGFERVRTVNADMVREANRGNTR